MDARRRIEKGLALPEADLDMTEKQRKIISAKGLVNVRYRDVTSFISIPRLLYSIVIFRS